MRSLDDTIAKDIDLPCKPNDALKGILRLLHLSCKLARGSIHFLHLDGKVAVNTEEIIEGGGIHTKWLS